MTAPQEPIVLEFTEFISGDCGCTWTYDIKGRTKSIKFLYGNCAVIEHRIAFNHAQAYREEIPVNLPKRGRGRPRVPGGQWHKKPVK